MATICVPFTIQAAGTAAFQDALELESIEVGTEAPGALIVSVFVVLPLVKTTRTWGVTVLVWFAFTKTRIQALRFRTKGMAVG